MPAYARLLYLDGPEMPEQAAAAELAGRQRIWPAIRGLSGLAGVYVLRRHDLGTVVITLATSIQTLDAVERAVMSTELLPGEDPALLPGPDRIEIHHVTGYHVPTASPAAGGGDQVDPSAEDTFEVSLEAGQAEQAQPGGDPRGGRRRQPPNIRSSAVQQARRDASAD